MRLTISDFAKERFDSDALNRMFNAVPRSEQCVEYDLEGRAFTIDKPVFYKKQAERAHYINGKGATFDIKMEKGAAFTGHVGSLLHTNQKKDERLRVDEIGAFQDSIHVDGLRFVGGDCQVELVGTSQSSFTRCNFRRGNRGFRGVFALQTIIHDCKFQDQKTEPLTLLTGAGDPFDQSEYGKPYLKGASVSNSQSNRCIISGGTRFISNNFKPDYHFKSCGNDGVLIHDNPVFEGLMPKIAGIFHDSMKSTTVAFFSVKQPHIEYVNPSPTETVFRIHGGIHIVLEDVYNQAVSCINVDAKTTTPGKGAIHINRPGYIGSGANSYKCNPSDRWIIRDTAVKDAFFKPEAWVGGKMPSQLFVYNGNTISGWNSTPQLIAEASAGLLGISNDKVRFGSKNRSFTYETSIAGIIDYKEPARDYVGFTQSDGDKKKIELK